MRGRLWRPSPPAGGSPPAGDSRRDSGNQGGTPRLLTESWVGCLYDRLLVKNFLELGHRFTTLMVSCTTHPTLVHPPPSPAPIGITSPSVKTSRTCAEGLTSTRLVAFNTPTSRSLPEAIPSQSRGSTEKGKTLGVSPTRHRRCSKTSGNSDSPQSRAFGLFFCDQG